VRARCTKEIERAKNTSRDHGESCVNASLKFNKQLTNKDSNLNSVYKV
jgi:hypothetical protein